MSKGITRYRRNNDIALIKRENPVLIEWMFYCGSRRPNRFEIELDGLRVGGLKETVCPVCGERSLTVQENDLLYGEVEYFVGCTQCGWETPVIPKNTKYDDAIAQFIEWLAVFNMLGRQRELVNVDLSLLYYPAGDIRNKQMKAYIKQEESNSLLAITLEEEF